jgi:hypothetical protein
VSNKGKLKEEGQQERLVGQEKGRGGGKLKVPEFTPFFNRRFLVYLLFRSILLAIVGMATNP